MKTFPLIRRKMTNEHYMAVLFGVNILYYCSLNGYNPDELIKLSAVILFSLIMDTMLNFIRYKEVKCAVSGAVTGAIVSIFSTNIPLWGIFVGVFCALLFGKHLGGGSGKNVFNPAVVGVIVVSLIFQLENMIFVVNPLIYISILFSLPFIIFRPYVSIPVILGMFLGLYLKNEFIFQSIIASGVFFWGCIIYTDPVTILSHKKYGVFLGFSAGLLSILLNSMVFSLVIVLLVNILSYILKNLKNNSTVTTKKFRPVKYKNSNNTFIDLTTSSDSKELDVKDLTNTDIINRIRENEVFGMGGGAFPTFKKINSVIDSPVKEKHIIINAVECDPGLIHDKWLLNNYFEEIVKGIEVICRCTDIKNVHLAIKHNFEHHLPIDFNLVKVKNYYPVGEERKLIYETLNIKFEKDLYPVDEGILVLNLQTVLAVYNSVYYNRKIENKFLTVANLVEGHAYVTKVKIGSRIKDISENIFKSSSKVFVGGGLMQAYLADDMSEVNKNVNFIAIANYPKYKESSYCSNCGLCNKFCPANLDVRRIADCFDSGDLKKAEDLSVDACIGCGLCSYNCLAGRNLSHRISMIKETMNQTRIVQ